MHNGIKWDPRPNFTEDKTGRYVSTNCKQKEKPRHLIGQAAITWPRHMATSCGLWKSGIGSLIVLEIHVMCWFMLEKLCFSCFSSVALYDCDVHFVWCSFYDSIMRRVSIASYECIHHFEEHVRHFDQPRYFIIFIDNYYMSYEAISTKTVLQQSISCPHNTSRSISSE
jgi:hypothetical protein